MSIEMIAHAIAPAGETVMSPYRPLALVAAIGWNIRGREGWAFVGTTITTAMVVTTYFVILFPNAMNGSTGVDLTLAEAASSPLTLKIMTWAAVIFTPVMLVYTAWNYWIFRKRVTPGMIPEVHIVLPAVLRAR